MAFASIAMELRVSEIRIVSPLVRSWSTMPFNVSKSTSLVMQGSVGKQTGTDVGGGSKTGALVGGKTGALVGGETGVLVGEGPEATTVKLIVYGGLALPSVEFIALTDNVCGPRVYGQGR